MQTNNHTAYSTEKGTGPTRAKRRKVAIACEECRSRKIRCDGSRPVCSACSRKYGPDAPCMWNIRPSQVELEHMRDLVGHFERRLQEVESRGKKSPPTRHSAEETAPAEVHLAYTSPERAPEELELIGDDHQPDTLWSYTRPGRNSVNKTGVPRNVRTPSTGFETGEEEVNSTTWNLDDDSHGKGYFGESSVSSCIKSLKSIVAAKIGSPPNIEPAKSMMDGVSLPFLMQEPGNLPRKDLKLVLPAKEVANSLMDIYFNLVHPLYPYIDGTELEAYYGSLWGRTRGYNFEPVCLAVINTIFALACQLNPAIKPEQRGPSAEIFYNRALELIDGTMTQLGSLQSVQCFLLLGQYLQSTNNSAQCWIFIGLAIRNAFGLGIQLPETSAAIKSSRRRELVRKVWGGCVMMDRLLSLTYGRPSMIGEDAADLVPLPLAVDEDYLSSDSEQYTPQPPGEPSMVEFFNQSLGLYKILQRILVVFYPQDKLQGYKSSEQPFSRLEAIEWGSSVLKLDEDLRTWEKNLPGHLLVSDQQAVTNRMFQRQAVVLRSRYLHVRTLLLRPMVYDLLVKEKEGFRSSTDRTLPDMLLIHCSVSCVKVAQAAVRHIYAYLPTNSNTTGPLAAWWFNLLYVYIASMILVGARASPVILEHISVKEIHESWAHAMAILQHFAPYSLSAQRIAALLRILFAQMDKNAAQLDECSALQGHNEANPNPGLSTSTALPMSKRAGMLNGPVETGYGVSDQPSLFPFLQDTSFVDAALSDLQNIDIPFDFDDMSWLESIP